MATTALREQRMTGWNMTEVLNDRLECTRCHASHPWMSAARPLVRQYSRIHRLRCTHCGEQVVAKVLGGRYAREHALQHARKEYEALCRLQSAFPQDERYQTLVPLAHLEHAASGIVVTQLAPGVDLMRYLRTLNAAGTEQACHSAGTWLKKLHDSDPQGRPARVGAEEKIDFLADTYGSVLNGDPATRTAYDVFARHAVRVDQDPIVAVRQHGDFKPDNMLCDGARYIGLDIRWWSTGAPEYDLAPFLNHLWLESGGVIGAGMRRRYDAMESALLAGYGGVGDMRTLRWVQLYFALCYMGEYRLRGSMAARYASWKIGPLVRKLAQQIREAT